MGGKTANKAGYFDKLKSLLEEYTSIFIVEIDNVSSQQMHEIRHALRNKGVVLMGKNTMVRDFPDTGETQTIANVGNFRFAEL
jgi:large subunit ribosomal protein LP0